MFNSQRILAVIIGRAGSKGLPGKNALELAGRPMICHTIDHARDSQCIDRILVSTDGRQIANAAAKHGCEVITRSPHLASDTATVDAAVREAVERSNDTADIIVMLYANVPVRPLELIDRAIQKLIETNGDSVQSYCEVGKYHPWWMSTLDDDGKVMPHVENICYRRQDLPPLFLPDGGVIAVTRESLFTIDPQQPHAFLGNDRRGIHTQPGEVIDVDSAIDLAVAEAIITQQDVRNRCEEAV